MAHGKPNPERERERARHNRMKVKTENARLRGDLRAGRPNLTVPVAADFVKLLAAGLPQLEALRWMSPPYFDTLSPQSRMEWLKEWLQAPYILSATDAWNKGRWEELDDDRRVDIALAHATNQMAHFLYTRGYHEVGGADLKKWTDAREALQARVDAKSGTSDSAYEQFLKSIVATQQGPPTLQSIGPKKRAPLTVPAAPLTES